MPPMGTSTHAEAEINGAGMTVKPEQKAKADPIEHGTGAAAKLQSFILRWDVLIVVFSVVPMVGFTAMQPYKLTRQGELECGALCVGSMTSVSSALGLVGAPMIGALSDQQGRKVALALGCAMSIVSYLVLAFSNSLIGLWIALIPPALLSHNFTVTKAIVADLAPPKERAGILGRLGLAVGLGFMAGPVVAPFVSTYREAALFAVGLEMLSLIAIRLLPDSEQSAEEKEQHSASHVFENIASAIKEVIVLAFAAPPSARVILFVRFGLSMGFHVFYTVMNVILRERFEFQPNDYSVWFAFIGGVYATSQLFAKMVIDRFGDNPTKLVIGCLCCIAVGRYVTAVAGSMPVLYVSSSLTIMALGVLNTSISTTVTRIASHDNVGGLMGVLDTAEKLAGVCGPTLGGALYASHQFAPVVAVIAAYITMGATVWLAYPRFVLPAMDQGDKAHDQTASADTKADKSKSE
mmetsp:Transcript_49252/g.98462  ORF Transcript_49252/g.98462 Transcript_49252/m.98462 type:complete len:465 (+) Transcript_49252:44-1438(+)